MSSTYEDYEHGEIEPAELHRRSVQGAAATGISQVIRISLQVLSQVVLARLLDPAEYGLIAMVAPVIGFISILGDLGLSTAVVQRKHITQREISALFWLNTTISLVMSLLLVAAAPIVGWIYHEPKTVEITVILAVLMFLGSLSIQPSAVLTREMKLTQRAIIDVVQLVIGISVGISTAYAGCGYWSLVYLQGASTISALILTWIVSGWMPSWRPHSDPSVVKMLRFGAALTLSNIATYFSMSADNFLVGAFDGKVALGLYDKSYRLVLQPLSQLSMPVARLAVPLLSRLNHEPAQYRASFRRMLQISMIVTTPLMICGIAFSHQIVSLLLGKMWLPMVPTFAWICFGGFASLLYSSSFWLFTSQGRGREQMTWTVITSSINVASFAVGIRWGAVGVASLSAITFVLVQTPILLWSATSSGPVTLKAVLDAIKPIAVAVCSTAAFLYALLRVVHPQSSFELAIGVAVTLGIFIGINMLMKDGRALIADLSSIARSQVLSLRTGRQKSHSGTV